MKIVEYANNNSNKNIVIITKTAEQANYIYNEIRINVMCLASVSKSKIETFNGVKIFIYPEYTGDAKFRGMTIDVLLFCNVNQGTRRVIKRYLLPGVATNGGIIGELAI